jgi:hypothetical protein
VKILKFYVVKIDYSAFLTNISFFSRFAVFQKGAYCVILQERVGFFWGDGESLEFPIRHAIDVDQ